MRPCRNRFCQGKLADCVPLKIEYCVPCQVALRDVNKLIARRLDGRDLPDDAAEFIALHPGGCSARELYNISGVKIHTIKNLCFRRVLQAVKMRDIDHLFSSQNILIWIIPQEEIIRLLDFVFNWISLRRAAVQIGAKHKTLCRDIAQKRIPIVTQKMIGKDIWVPKNTLPYLEKSYHKVRQSLEARRGIRPLNLNANEITAKQAAKRFDLPYHTLLRSLRRGKIKSRKRRGQWIVMPNS